VTAPADRQARELAKSLRLYALVGSSLDLPTPKRTANEAAEALDALAAELERVTAENDRLRAALSSALANEAQWWKKAQAALSPTYGPVGSLDGKGGVGL
jgi:hypothetical protein